MKILKYSDVTPQNIFLNRRKFVEALGLTSLAFVATPTTAKLNYSTSAKPNTIDEITNYNNFYEFGTSKTDPAKYAHSLTTNPWEITFEGISKNKKKFTKITQNLESFDKVKLNFFELGSPIPRNEKVEKQSRAYNWILQAGYFASAMFKKKRAR